MNVRTARRGEMLPAAFLELAPHVEVRVWDTTADTRYMVLPERPAYSAGWNEAQLVDIVTRDALIGVARLPER